VDKQKFLLKNMPRGTLLAKLAEVYPDADPAAMDVFGALLEISSEILSAVNSALAKDGITQARFRLLLHLRRAGKGGLHPMDLAKALGVGRASVTGLVDGAEKAGLARRSPCGDDRRAIMVLLTPDGRRLVDSLAPERLRKISLLMNGLSGKKLAELSRLLDTIKANLPAFRKI
jgi:DNA-binding MarR family transcriptional regulator